MRVVFPLVMKMEMSKVIKNADSLTLKEIQIDVYNYFWKIFDSDKAAHGTFANVKLIAVEEALVDGVIETKKVRIETDEILKICLKTAKYFQAIFDTPHTKRGAF
jgi:hypothetical protein